MLVRLIIAKITMTGQVDAAGGRIKTSDSFTG
jgi:hypothetical protein